MFTWAMRQGLMGPTPYNPASVTENPDARLSRDRVLKDTELAAIWRACKDDDFGRIVRLLICTACRREEIGGLRWGEIDQDAGTITLPKERVKNNHEHVLPLTPLALEIIGSVKEQVGRTHLFGDRSSTGFTTWYVAKHISMTDSAKWRSGICMIFAAAWLLGWRRITSSRTSSRRF
jgi:integrase